MVIRYILDLTTGCVQIGGCILVVKMRKNPLVNAGLASGYIVLVVTILNLLGQRLGNKPDTAFAPVVFLSLVTLSAAVMAFVFFYQPVVWLIEGKKKEAVKLFGQTVGVFAVITTVGLVLLFVGVI